MYNVAISVALAAASFGLVALLLSPVAAIIPATMVFALAWWLLSRRIAKQVEEEMKALVPLLQARKVEEAKAKIASVQKRYGRWQILLERQLDAQVGMIDYLQMKFDAALPKLEKGKFRNWNALVCIGAIHHRKGRKEQAYESLASAAKVAPKESVVYLVWATLLTRDGKRTEALQALDGGLKAMPDSEHLKNLRNRVANKKKIDTKQFPQTWYQFFPEELAQQQLMRGRKRGPGPGQAAQQPRMSARQTRRR